MDVEELDAWLGTGQGDDEDTPPWREPRPRAGDLTAADGDPAPKRWPRLVGVGAAACLLVVVLAVVGGGSPAEEVAPAGAVDPLAVPATVAAVSATPAADGATTPDPATPVAATSDVGDRVGTGVDPVLGSAAVIALREWLPGATPDRDRYLEWAFAVGSSPLGQEVAVVHVDALWLAGTDGSYDTAHRGRWAVPVRQDGAVLGEPWAVGAPEPIGADPMPPPVLRQRVEEVEAALTADGWDDVVVHGSEPHPELPAVWVALVDGTDPAAVSRVGASVWLADLGGLEVLAGPEVTGVGR